MSIALLCSSGFAMRSATRKLRVKSAVHKEDGRKVKNDAPSGAARGSLMEAAEKIEAKDVHISRTTQGCETEAQPTEPKLRQLCEAYINTVRKALGQQVSEDGDFKARILNVDQDIQGCTLEQAREKCEKHWCQISGGDEACDAFQNVVNGKEWEGEFGKRFQSSVNDLKQTEKQKYMACTLDSFWRKCQTDRPKRPCKVTPFCEEDEALAFFSSFRGKGLKEAMSKWISNHQYQECQNQKPRVVKRECQEKECSAKLLQVEEQNKERICSPWNQANSEQVKELFLDKLWEDSNIACYANEIDTYCGQA